MSRPLWSCFGLALIGVLAIARPVHAQDGLPTFAPPGAEVDDPSELPRGHARPAAPDTRTGHVLISGNAGFTGPTGGLSDSFPQSGAIGTAPSFGGTLGIGVGRSAVVEIGGSYAKLPASAYCIELLANFNTTSTCAGSTYEVGLGLVYHVAQGIAVDPWISYGVAFRSISLTIPDVLKNVGVLASDATSFHSKGIDVARFAIGADFYPIPQLGFGPYVEANFGSYLWRSGDSAGTIPAGSIYAFVGIGVRLTLDPVRFFSAPAASEQPKAARR